MRTFFNITMFLMFCLTSFLGASGSVEVCMHSIVDWHLADVDENGCHDDHDHSHHQAPCEKHQCPDSPDEYAFSASDGHACTHVEIEGVVDPLLLNQQTVEAPELQVWESVATLVLPELRNEPFTGRLLVNRPSFSAPLRFSERSSVLRI